MATSVFRRRCLSWATFAGISSFAWLLAIPPATAAAPDDPLSEGLRNSEAGQVQVQTQAQELATQLRGMSAEFERNGLKGDEVKTLDLISASIGTMSEQEMTRIIGLLGRARTLGDQQSMLQQVAAAYTGQKNLTTQMKDLVALYQKDQAAANIAAALTKLAERQSSNLQTGIAVAQWNSGKKAEEVQSDLKASLEVQSSEQAALRDEVKQAAAKLQAAARNPSDPAAARAQAALQKFAQLNAMLDQATADLKDGHIFKALSSEKQARDGMRQLARDLTPQRETPTDALRQTEKDIAAMIAQQKEMINKTAKVKDAPTNIAKWAEGEMKNPESGVAKTVAKEHLESLNPEQLAENDKIKAQFRAKVTMPNELQLASLESKANELANHADQMSQDLQKDAAPTAAAVKTAQEKMQAARADLDERNAAAAWTNQQTAIAQMEQAQQQVQAQIAAQDAAVNADRMTQLQAAKAQAQQLAAQQNAASQQHAAQPQAAVSNAAQEADLKSKTQALQQKAAQAQAPGASDALKQAAAQMQKASDALKQPAGQAQAQAAEAAAAAALQNANAQLDQEIAQTAAAEQQLKKVEDALAALEKIITGQEKVQADTALTSAAPGAAIPNEKRAPKAPAAKVFGSTEIAARQTELKKNTAALVDTLKTPEVQPAIDPLNSAQSQMENSRAALARSAPAAARDPQRFAMTSLLLAKTLLSGKKAELAQQTNPTAALAAQDQQNTQVADQIAQAQAQAAAAQQQLAQPQGNQPPQGQQEHSQGQQQPGQPRAQAQQGQQGQPPPAPASQGEPPGGQQTAQTQNAQQALAQAANAAGQAAANNAARAQSAALSQALAAAQQALNQAANAAAQGDQSTAQAQTAQAQQALAQAQGQAQAAQSGLAQAGQNGSTPAGGRQGGPQGSQPGSKKDGKSPKGGQPGTPQTAANGNQPSEGDSEGEPSTSAGNDPRDPGKISQGNIEKGARGAGKQASAFTALPARDRAALQQSQTEKYPQEYGAMIEQYMRSLADQPAN